MWWMILWAGMGLHGPPFYVNILRDVWPGLEKILQILVTAFAVWALIIVKNLHDCHGMLLSLVCFYISIIKTKVRQAPRSLLDLENHVPKISHRGTGVFGEEPHTEARRRGGAGKGLNSYSVSSVFSVGNTRGMSHGGTEAQGKYKNSLNKTSVSPCLRVKFLSFLLKPDKLLGPVIRVGHLLIRGLIRSEQGLERRQRLSVRLLFNNP
jgi:hypothetical protein